MPAKIAVAIKVLGVVFAAASAYFVGLPTIYQALIVLISADMISGALRAYEQKVISAQVARDGVLRKVGELLLVAVAAYLQNIIPAASSVPLPQAVAAFYVYTEAVSLIENLAALGVPIPQFLKDALAILNPQKAIGMTREG